MPPAKRSKAPAKRNYDPARVRQALIGQVEAVAAAAHALTDEQCARPSGLPGWDVQRLLIHIALQIDSVPRFLAGPESKAAAAEVDLPAWALSWGHHHGGTSRAQRAGEAPGEDAAAGPDPAAREEADRAAAGGAARIDEAVAQLEPVLESAVRDDLLIPYDAGAMRMLDFTVTRLVELVVHSDDLARATGSAVTFDRQALAATVRLLTDALAVKAPGASVEVRVPPFAVVKCVEGPRHTRGTPPNVVETDPLTWIRLAAGRVGWDRARNAAAVSASGERADLSGLLPLLG